eukprot:2589545-Pyramimonas_sp.AAC.1
MGWYLNDTYLRLVAKLHLLAYELPDVSIGSLRNPPESLIPPISYSTVASDIHQGPPRVPESQQ